MILDSLINSFRLKEQVKQQQEQIKQQQEQIQQMQQQMQQQRIFFEQQMQQQREQFEQSLRPLLMELQKVISKYSGGDITGKNKFYVFQNLFRLCF